MPKKSAGTTLLKSKAIRIEIRGGNNETHPGRTLMVSSETTFPSNINFADSDEASVNLKKSNSITSSEEQADGSIKFPSSSSLQSQDRSRSYPDADIENVTPVKATDGVVKVGFALRLLEAIKVKTNNNIDFFITVYFYLCRDSPP